MADHTLKERVEFLWNQSKHHRGKRLALWAKEGKSRKARARRWEAIEKFLHQHAASAGVRHEMRRWRMFHKMRVWAGGVAKRIRRAIHRAQHQHQGSDGLAGVQVTTTPGDPHWGGGNDVIHQFVEPFMNARGLPTGSGKRTPAENAAVGGSPTSDHLTTHTTTMARDFPTFAGEDDARALAEAMGNHSWQMNSYATFNIVVDGHTFRVQILWGAAIGHGDHVHVGVGLVA
jgi:hypothetical protein